MTGTQEPTVNKEKVMNKTIKEQTYYEPIYFAEKSPSDDRCTLMTRHYRKYVVDSGKIHTTVKVDATVYDNEQEMAKAIEEGNMLELPKESDGNPLFVPADFKSSSLRRLS